MSRCEEYHPGSPFESRKNGRGCRLCILAAQRIRRAGLEPATVCKHCGVPFSAERNRTFCRDCAPTRADWERINKYNIDKFQFDAMYFEQDGTCAICHEAEATHVDHDHACCSDNQSCGRCVRGLLCHSCNVAIGLLGDSVARLASAILYLEE